VDKFLTHEIHSEEETEESTPQQGLSLKSNDIVKQTKESKNDEDVSLAMIANELKKMLQEHIEFKGIWKGSSSRRNERNSKVKFSSKDDINRNACYGCRLLGP